MKLYYSEASPYVRKVRVVAAEKNIPLQLVQTTPFDNDPEFLAANPLGKIPALVSDEGEAYTDSSVICAYLEVLEPSPALYPSSGKAYITVLQREFLALGIMDAAVKLIIESRRPQGTEWDVWVKRQQQAILRACDALEKDTAQFQEGDVFVDQLTIACALEYVDFRHGHLGWRTGRPALSAWYERFCQRPSLKQTVPVVKAA